MKNLNQYLFYCCILLIQYSAFSQEPTIQWDNTIGGLSTDILNSAIQTTDGGYLLAGYSKSGISGDKTEAAFAGGDGNDYWVIKTDASGNITWQNTIGGTGSDYLTRVIQSDDGGFLLGGYSNSTFSGDKTELSLGGYDYWILKLDASGNIIWQNTIGGSGDDKLSDIIKLPTGDYILAGYSSSPVSGDKIEASLGGSDYWVLKINSTGSIIWQNTIGGSGSDYLRSINKTSDGGFLLCGESGSDISGDKTMDAAGTDFWVVKINNLGIIVWQKGIGGNSSDYLVSAVKNPDGSFILAGYSLSENSGDKSGFNALNYCGSDFDEDGWDCISYDFWIVKIDISGNIVWERSFGDKGYERVTSIVSSGDGGYLIGGYVDYDSYTNGPLLYYRSTKISDNGYVVWSKDIYGAYTTDIWGEDYVNYTNILNASITTSDGGYLLAGYSDGNAGLMKSENKIGGTDFWIVKLGPETCIPAPIYSDYDGDGKGGEYLASTCEFITGKWVDNQDDCNDNHSAVSSVMDEICDGMDNNCDAISDIGCAVVPSIEWDQAIGGTEDDILVAITQAADGGYLLGGYSVSEISGDKTEEVLGLGSSPDYWVVKTDASGEIIWQNTIGSFESDYLTSISTTIDGGFILGGWSYNGGGGDKTEAGAGSLDWWLVKLDASGNIIWQNTIGGSSLDYLYYVKSTSDGGFIAVGKSYSGISGDKTEMNYGSYDYWIIKFDNSGNIQWQNTIGGSGVDIAMSADETLDGGFIIGGYSGSGISGEKTEPVTGGYDYWIIKLDATGSIVWQNTIEGSASDYLDQINATTDGGYIASGYSNSIISGDKSENNNGGYDYWIIKLGATGNIIWQNTIGSATDDFLTDAIELNNGGLLVGGYSRGSISGDKIESFIPSYSSTNAATSVSYDYWLVRIDASGNIIWQNTIGGNLDDQMAGLLQATDGSLVIAGTSSSLVSSDKSENGAGEIRRFSDDGDLWLEKDKDYWILKLEPECIATDESCNSLDDNCNGLIDDAVVEAINISAGGTTTFCQGGSVLLSATYSGASIQWKKNGVNIAGATSSTYSVNKTGNYSAVTTSPCDTVTSSTISVTVNKNPNASISAGGATTFCAGGSVTLTEIPVAGSTYQWYKGASLIAGETSTNYVATTAGNYRCRVTKTATGCYKNSNAILVTVPCKEVEGIINEENIFSLYPNPNNGTFSITFASFASLRETEDAILEIYNSLGQIIYTQQINSTDNNLSPTISLYNISSGIYFVRVRDGNNYQEQKLIIE